MRTSHAPSALPAWPIARPGLLMAKVGVVTFIHISSALDEEGEHVHAEELARMIDTRPADVRVAVVYDVPQSMGISALGRSGIAKLLNEREEKLARTTAAYALATPSAFVRGMLQAVFWIAPPPYPHRMVASMEEALDFIALHLPQVSPARALAEYEATLARHEAVVKPGRAAETR
jgi:hypothetical protein